MNRRTTFRTITAAFVLAIVAAAPIVLAASLRFDEPDLYQVNKADAGSFPAVIGDSIFLTSGYAQTRSVWFKAPQAIDRFTASFKYRLASISGLTFGQGVTFAIQNSPAGVGAIGTSGSGYFGYQGIANSVAVSIEVYNSSAASTFVGSYVGGAVSGGGALSAAPVDARQGRDIDVAISYDGTRLSVTLADGAQIAGPYLFNVGSLEARVGGSSAYVGFTANTDGNEFNPGATQVISDFTFQAVPEPGGLLLAMPLAAAAACWRRMRARL